MSKPKFVCAECGEEFPASQLSQFSLEIAGTGNKQTAAVVLPAEDRVCIACGDPLEDETENLDHWQGRTDQERWEYSGVEVTPGRAIFLTLNY